MKRRRRWLPNVLDRRRPSREGIDPSSSLARLDMQFYSEPFYPRADALQASLAVIEALITQLPDQSYWRDYLSAHKARFALDADLVARVTAADARVLDIGASPPVLMRLLVQAGFDTYGVDIDPDRLPPTELDIRRCNIETQPQPFEDAFFDTVCLFEVFEHLRIDLTFTLGEIHRILKPGGRLIVTTPNLGSLEGLWNFLVKGQAYSCLPGLYPAYESVSTKGHAGHIREYTMPEMVSFLSDAGFDIETVVWRGRYRTNLKQALCRLRPRLRPYAGYVCQKPLDDGAR